MFEIGKIYRTEQMAKGYYFIPSEQRGVDTFKGTYLSKDYLSFEFFFPFTPDWKKVKNTKEAMDFLFEEKGRATIRASMVDDLISQLQRN